MALTQIDDRGLKTPIDLLDNEKIRLGTGNDLELYHDGTTSHIHDDTSAVLQLTNDDLRLKSTGDETMLRCIANGAVELYHNNSKKFETSSTGVTITGDANWNDNGKAEFGNAADLQIYHDGSGSHITESGTGLLDIDTNTFRVRNTAGNENQITAEANGAVGLYYDNSKRLETTSAGATVTGSLGIGTGSPTGPLSIASGTFQTTTPTPTGDDIVISGNQSLGMQFLTLASGTSNNNIYFGDTDDPDIGMIRYAHADNSLQFRTNTLERLRIVSNGEVGINVTDPEAYGANGTGYLGLVVEAPSGNNSGITIRSNYAGGGLLAFADGSGSGAERKNLALQASHVNKTLDVLVDNSAVARFTAHGFTPNPSDSAAANALDDYEEGTYTPSFGYASDDGNKQYSTQSGSYTKIGRIVIVNIAVILTNAGTGSGQVTVSLPFAVADSLASTSIEANGTSGFFSGLTSSVSCITLLAAHNTTNASLQKVSGTQAAATSGIVQSNLGNAASFRFSLVYATST